MKLSADVTTFDGPCGQGFTVTRVRFLVNGKQITETVPERIAGNRMVASYVWNVVPGQNGVPLTGQVGVEVGMKYTTSTGLDYPGMRVGAEISAGP